jgi:protein TonB
MPKPEMTLPVAKPKEPPRREEKRAEPPERQVAEKKKEPPTQPRPPADPVRRPETAGKREPELPIAGGGAPGTGHGPGPSLALGTPGGALSLDTADFPFTYYLRQVTNRIEQNWLRPEQSVGRVVVYFRIKRDGTIVDPEVKESSRNRAVDLLAAGAVKRSEPFPPLPVEFGGDYLGIYLCFGLGAQCPGQKQG